MQYMLLLAFVAFTVPAIAAAQNIQSYLVAFLLFINNYIIPLLIALAFLFFVWNVFLYFIKGGASEDSQTKAKSLALWGVLAFVIMLSVWGITNVVVNSLNINRTTIVCPDYLPNCRSTGTNQPLANNPFPVFNPSQTITPTNNTTSGGGQQTQQQYTQTNPSTATPNSADVLRSILGPLDSYEKVTVSKGSAGSVQQVSDSRYSAGNSCTANLSLMKELAESASSEYSFAICVKQSTGQTEIVNTTSESSTCELHRDDSRVDGLLNEGYQCSFVHNHPKSCLAEHGMEDKRPPSPIDIYTACLANDHISLVADPTGIWTYQVPTDLQCATLVQITGLMEQELLMNFTDESSADRKQKVVDMITKIRNLSGLSETEQLTANAVRQTLESLLLEVDFASYDSIQNKIIALYEDAGIRISYTPYEEGAIEKTCDMLGAVEPGENI